MGFLDVVSEKIFLKKPFVDSKSCVL